MSAVELSEVEMSGLKCPIPERGRQNREKVCRPLLTYERGKEALITGATGVLSKEVSKVQKLRFIL